jgi:tetratricopeptide (TPR) repeat protein
LSSTISYVKSAFIAVVVLQPLAACSDRDSSGSRAQVPTYHRDVAPLLAVHCGTCHSESGVAPFSIFEYEEVKQRASRIARVTRGRSMPPWLPAPGYAEYLNDPSLTEDEIDLLARWVDAGAPQGRRPFFFSGPNRAEEWELGEPDLVLTMSEGYLLRPSSTDEYRVFVVPVPIATTQYVRGIDFRPIIEPSHVPRTEVSDSTTSGRSTAHMPLHHVVLMIDPTRSSRRLDAEDPQPGYEGVSPMSGAHPPDGFFLGWTPGKRPSALPEGLAWRVDPGTDLVIQTHLQPTAQPVEVNASIGLYFADERPGRLPSSILLSSISIDIPPGDSAYVVEDSYPLPVEVEVLSVYPHAHFLAREMELFAELPDGARRDLLRIEDWDFDWQDEYRFREAVPLPAGSVLRMRYTYDNSSANPQNPHDPPRRTTFGPRSTDEMAELTVQVLTTDPSERDELERSAVEKTAQTLIEGARFAIEREPEDPRAHFNLGVILQRSGRREEAISAYRSALSVGGDDDPEVHVAVGNVLAESGAYADAIGHLRRALELDPEYAHGHFSIGRALEAAGAVAEAEGHHRRAIELLPGHARSHAGLGRVLRSLGRPAEAETQLRRALEISPDLLPAHLDLASLLSGVGRQEEAIDHYRAVLDLEPSFAVAHINLAGTYHLLGRFEEAAEHYRRTVELEPENAEAHLALGNVLRTTGNPREAVEHLQAAVRLEPRAADPMLALAWALATEPDPDIRDPGTALRLAQDAIGIMSPPDPRALATLAAAHAAAGDFVAGVATGQDALDLARRTGDTTLAQSIEVHLELYRQGRPYVAGR